MSQLHSRLAALRRHLMVVVSVRGLCLTAATLMSGLLLAGLCDVLAFRALGFETWSILRAGFLVSILGVTGVVSYLWLMRPLSARLDDLSLALRVEEHYPILNDSLASTVQFLESSDGANQGTSPALQKEAVQRAMRLAQSCDFKQAINSHGLRLSVAASVLLFVVVVSLCWYRPALARNAFVRLADPFGDHSWVGTQTGLTVNFPTLLAIGQPLTITGEVSGLLPSKAEIEFDDGVLSRRHVEIKEIVGGQGRFIASGILIPSDRREIRFRVRAGDAMSPRQVGAWHIVALRQPPQLVSLHGKPSPQYVVRQPSYTELPEFLTVPAGNSYLDVVAGSHITLRAATDRPITRAWVEFRPLMPGAKDALLLAGLGPRHPFDSVATHALAHSVAGRVFAVLGSEGADFTIRFVPAFTCTYVLNLEDKDGLTRSYAFELNVRQDPAPAVNILRPSVSQSVLANAEITLQVLATDEVYALRSVYLEYRRKDKQGRWLDPEPKRLSFYDHGKAERGFPQILSMFSASPLPWPMSPLHLRPKQLLITHRWSLRGLGLEGETLVIQACAEDFNDVAAYPPVGRSHEIELKIVAKTALAAVLEEHELHFQQELLKLRDMQEKAIGKVIGAEQQWRASGKLRPEDAVELAEAEQLQREIQARIGDTKDDGIRAELAQLEQMLKDNKLPNSEITERFRTLRDELERISRENLPKIEPALTKARRDLDSPDKLKLPDLKDPGELGEARAEQEKVERALSEMLKFMEERSTLNQLKGELRAILHEQQDREKEVVKLQEEVGKKGDDILRKNNELKAELRRTAELQRRLADRAERLIDQLNDLSEKLQPTDPGLAEMLASAAKIGGPLDKGGEAVANAMREVAEQLRDEFDQRPPSAKSTKAPNLYIAGKTQGENIKVLDRMIEALDQTRADEVERLVVRQKKEEQQLQELAEKTGALQKEIEAARKIADPQQREAALKKLGDQLRQLQEQAEASARELGRAQANEAAADIKEAVKKMERILRQLQRGEEPDETLKQAQEKIGAAMEKLEQAREMAEEELSREQIAKIVDRLKGLKERQDALAGESQRLRKDFLQKTNWTQPKVQSLDDLRAAQDTLGGEMALFKPRLKGAKVYSAILDRSHQDMMGATKRLESWLTKANQHKTPRKLEENEFAEEKTMFEAALALQVAGAERIQRLIDALLPELDPPPADPKPGDAKEPQGGPPPGAEKKGGIKAQDGIPPVAQLKALKAEQLDINSRTKEFAQQHPNTERLTDQERAELSAIHTEQERLLQLFRELVTAGGEGGKR